MTTNERLVHKIDVGQVQTGDLMAFIQYVKVADKIGTTGIRALNVAGGPSFDINGPDLITSMASADRFTEVVKVSKTKAAEILVSSHNRPLTVSFIKKDGSERVLRGRLLHSESLLGRSMCEDLTLPINDKNRTRLVDHRTIQYLVVDGVRYEVKL